MGGISIQPIIQNGIRAMIEAKAWKEGRTERLFGLVEIDEVYVKAGMKGKNNRGEKVGRV